MWCIRPWVKTTVLIMTALIVVYIAWESVHDPEALWAPGHLSRHHADIDKCELCHEAFVGPTNRKCRVCHTLKQFQFKSPPDIYRVHQDVIDRQRSCRDCHTEHRGVLAMITLGTARNPHGEFIFRATGAFSCSDCHTTSTEKNAAIPKLLENSMVRHLIDEGEGAHRSGHFAQCLKCHRGGQLDVEEEDDDDEEED